MRVSYTDDEYHLPVLSEISDGVSIITPVLKKGISDGLINLENEIKRLEGANSCLSSQNKKLVNENNQLKQEIKRLEAELSKTKSYYEKEMAQVWSLVGKKADLEF